MKASEVFDLPVAAGDANYNGDDLFGADRNGIWHATFCSQEQAQIAAHAINHADALADALAMILMNKEDEIFETWLDDNHPSGDVSEVQYKFEKSSLFKDFMNEFDDARKALAAYRGAK